MLKATLLALLTDFAKETGALQVAIAESSKTDLAPHQLSTPLGRQRILLATLPGSADRAQVEVQLAHLARDVRECARQHGQGILPKVSYPSKQKKSPRQAVLTKMRTFVDAVVESCDLDCMFLLLRGRVLIESGAPSELQRSRIDLLIRQIDAAAVANPLSSHTELVTEDVYGRTFWYGACLIGFSSRPWSVDFVRFRSLQATRELAVLLAMLDDDPDDPAKISPRP
jgi:hypothetical protein